MVRLALDLLHDEFGFFYASSKDGELLTIYDYGIRHSYSFILDRLHELLNNLSDPCLKHEPLQVCSSTSQNRKDLLIEGEAVSAFPV